MKIIKLLIFMPFLVSCGNPVKTYTDYYENGNKRIEVSFLNGKLHGAYIMWFENGSRQLETCFSYDTIVAPFIVWLKDGKEATDIIFNHGWKVGWDEHHTDKLDIEKKIIYGWLRYEADKLRNKIKHESLTYHRIKCLLFSFV